MADAPVRLIAMYLPQFHPIPENDQWWGEGFVEWDNVRRAKPLFPDHYQPHVPSVLGYYDLRDSAVFTAQANLARQYGIYGFCYYYYWFHGRKLLERPFEDALKSGRPDFPFCLCWANENWTRRWDGKDQELLIEQRYSTDDSLHFIRDLIPAFQDSRYIRVNGKPLLIVYRPAQIPDPVATTNIWRTAAHEAGLGNLYLVRVDNFLDKTETGPAEQGFDADMEFAPHWGSVGKPVTNANGAGLQGNERMNVFDYEECLRRMLLRRTPPYKLFRGVFPSWDNTPRRKIGATLFANTSPENYAFWLACMIRYTQANFEGDERLLFVNAWNEWGEGCHLEPDEKYGLRYLEATQRALETLPDSTVERDRLLVSLHQQVAKRDRKIEELQLGGMELRKHIEELYRSWSWKTTRPLRYIHSLITRTCKR